MAALSADLNALALPEEEIEIEREMLDGLEQVSRLHSALATNGLPVVVTGHRVVGSDVCHFISPVSMPDEASQPSGRLILTNARAIFVGGPNGSALAWHAVGEVAHAGRDLLLVRADRQKLYRFRCNTFADALTAVFLARRLLPARRRPTDGL